MYNITIIQNSIKASYVNKFLEKYTNITFCSNVLA